MQVQCVHKSIPHVSLLTDGEVHSTIYPCYRDQKLGFGFRCLDIKFRDYTRPWPLPNAGHCRKQGQRRGELPWGVLCCPGVHFFLCPLHRAQNPKVTII